MKQLRRFLILTITVVATLVTTGQPLFAQPVLSFTRIINNWPTVELYFKLACNGGPEYTTDKQYFSITENNKPITNFTLWCPDPRQRCAISVALVLDASSSMAGANNQGAKVAANAFVNLMDGIDDEATVIWFADHPVVQQNMTIDKTALHQAVNDLPAQGNAAMRDGIYQGLQELIQSGSNPCRAVIAMADGGDNASSHTSDEIIALANRNRIKIFTVGLGSSSQSELESIALQTGGKYYQTPSPDLLEVVYEEISTIIFAGFLECLITYQATCPNGQTRMVNLGLNNFCGGDDVKTRTYRAPLDTNVARDLFLSVDDGDLNYGETKSVAIRYSAPKSVTIGPAELIVAYGGDLVSTASVNFTGTALENLPTTVKDNSGSFTIDIQQPVQLQGQGILAYMDLTAKTSTTSSESPLNIIEWNNYSASCLSFTGEDGVLAVHPVGIGSFAPSFARSFSLAPNPTDGAFNVALEFEQPTEFSMRVVNTLGQTVYEHAVREKRMQYNGSIRLEDAAPGVYFFMLESSGRYDYRKLVVR